MLLILIILELLWTVIRFLKKKKFILGPFFSIGIIAALRRILLIEAQTSTSAHVDIAKLYEIGLSAGVVLVLMIAYWIESKSQNLEQ
ncbi:phosphate-starvation-inducible PsiE family protein [Nitrospirota bacterium]